MRLRHPAPGVLCCDVGPLLSLLEAPKEGDTRRPPRPSILKAPYVGPARDAQPVAALVRGCDQIVSRSRRAAVPLTIRTTEPFGRLQASRASRCAKTRNARSLSSREQIKSSAPTLNASGKPSARFSAVNLPEPRACRSCGTGTRPSVSSRRSLRTPTTETSRSGHPPGAPRRVRTTGLRRAGPAPHTSPGSVPRSHAGGHASRPIRPGGRPPGRGSSRRSGQS